MLSAAVMLVAKFQNARIDTGVHKNYTFVRASIFKQNSTAQITQI